MKKILFLTLFGFFNLLLASYSYDKQWLNILHYKKTLFGYKSLIDDKNFFISKNGQTNPKEELLSSIKLIKTSPSKFACRFPLRYQYINEHYNISNFDISQCVELNKYLKNVNPYQAVMVFADAHMNKPASMFGHTFIRIDTPKKLPLLSYAVNYAAHVTDTNGILFAFKGIFGFYKAYYSILPYYEKLREYSDQESRDLWSYNLNLTPDEVKKMAFHVWELKDIYSDYYFFTENCSYNILFLIDVAKPNVNTTDYFKSTVIPMDTIKLLYKKGLISNVQYSASLVTQIKYISKPIKNKQIIVDIANNQTKPTFVLDMNTSNEYKARILDSSVRYLKYLSIKHKITKKEFTNRFLKILSARSKVKYTSNYKYPTPINPIHSHDSRRILLAIGRENHKDYIDFGLRLAYHSIEDNIQGFKYGSSLQFGDFKFRYHKNLKIEKIGLVEILSLTPRDTLFKPISWKINGGFYKEYINNKEKLVFKINPGGGFTKEFKNTMLYGMFNSDFNFNSNYHKGYSFGFGPQFGMIKYFQNNAILIDVGYINYIFGDKNHKLYTNSKFRHTINRNNAILLNYEYQKTYKNHINNISLLYYYYF